MKELINNYKNLIFKATSNPEMVEATQPNLKGYTQVHKNELSYAEKEKLLEMDAIERMYKEDLKPYLNNIYVQCYDPCNVGIWINIPDCGTREALPKLQLPFIYRYRKEWQEHFKKLQESVQTIIEQPRTFFFCSYHNRVENFSELETNVFAGYYCKDAYKEATGVKNLVDESRTSGFYD